MTMRERIADPGTGCNRRLSAAAEPAQAVNHLPARR
jgi:hypothetical protein